MVYRLGKTPRTGKALKPITPYMIEKYICPKEEIKHHTEK